MADRDDPVEVFRTTDPALLSLVKSLLEGEGIPFMVQGENTAGLFPMGPAAEGGLFGRALGAVVRVPASREEEARALLEALDGI